MKRTFAAAVAAVTACTSIWLAGTEAASATAARPKPLPSPSATLRVVPKWTYQGGGKLAVIAACSNRADLRLITSKMLPRPVTLRKAGNLLIKVTNKTHPGKYTIMLLCVGMHQQADAADMKSVRVLKVLSDFYQPDPPALPKHFKPAVTVSSGPPARKKTPHHKKKRH
jgi:hypothetical protein